MQSGFRRQLVASLGGLLMALLVVLLELNAQQRIVTGPADVMRQADAMAYDLRLRALLDRQLPLRQPVLIVDLDEASLERFGQWPWERAEVARLMQRISDLGAAVIGFDMVFSEPERNPVERILEDPGTRLPEITEQRLQHLAPALDGDRRLARTIADLRGTDVVLGVFLSNRDTGIGARPAPVVQLSPDDAEASTFLSFRGWTGPPSSLLDTASEGHVITVPDDLDGVIRRAPLLVRMGDDLLPSLALTAVCEYLLIDRVGIETVRQGDRLIPTSLTLGDRVRIPLDERGRVLVPYRGPAFTFPYVSAADVLEDHLTATQRAAFRDALVLVGTSAIGIADLRSTPTAQVYPGVEVHATLADALLEAAQRALEPGAPPAFPGRGDLTDETTLLGLTVVGVALALSMPLLGAVGLGLLSALLVSGWLALGAWAWLRGVDLPIIAPVLLVITITAFNLLRGFFLEASSRRELRGMFDQYVPPAHIERMLALGQSPTLEGESRVMSVLFADIKGFTHLSEGLSAPELKQVLNECFTPLTRVILDRQGTVDKYVGDMMMAFWNAPLVDARHREHALDAALAMAATARQLSETFVRRGLPPISMGIGINTGLMNVGDMGSDFRRAYTVIGDAVNLGSRIEGLNRHYGTDILVGEQTRDETEGYLFRFVDRVAVKGREAAVRVYELLGREEDADEALLAEVLRWHGAYWKFLHQDWEGAAADLHALIAAAPTTDLYRVYRARIDSLRHIDLPPEWNGETVMNEK